MSNKSFNLIGNSPWVRKILSDIDIFASSPLSVLIIGETGTGKDIIANLVHRMGARAAFPFLAVNCATLENLADSELFGHLKGSFSGAIKDTHGFIAGAEGGTLFLDEVADLPKSTQVKLLRFLDTGEYFPVGSSIARHANVRVVCATNTDLREAIRTGRFREDLYFRLSAVTLETMPLRRRPEDISLLAEHFAQLVVEKVPQLSRKCGAIMEAYAWPGNARQLKIVMARLIHRYGLKPITPQDITIELQIKPSQSGIESYQVAKKRMLGEFDRRYFQILSENSCGSLAKMLQDSGMHKKNYYQKLKEIR